MNSTMDTVTFPDWVPWLFLLLALELCDAVSSDSGSSIKIYVLHFHNISWYSPALLSTVNASVLCAMIIYYWLYSR